MKKCTTGYKCRNENRKCSFSISSTTNINTTNIATVTMLLMRKIFSKVVTFRKEIFKSEKAIP